MKDAYSPAKGLSAIAASEASFILMPDGKSVAAHVTIMKKAIMSVIEHPSITSSLDAL